MRAPSPRQWIFGLLFVGALVSPSEVRAYDRQISLGLGAGWGLAPLVEELPDHGPNFALSGTIGLDDTWSLGAHLLYAVHPAFEEGAPLHLGFAGLEAMYLLDVLTVVPFFGVGAGALFTAHQDELGIDFTINLLVGLDYHVSREFLLGVDIRPYLLLTALSTEPIYLSFTLRASLLFDI